MGDQIPASTAPMKYAFKQLPKFDPIHSRAWASDVKMAFSERKWTNYLAVPTASQSISGNITPATSSALDIALDEHIETQAKAFLVQSIPYEYRYGLEEYNTAATIFHAIETKYNSQSRYDELRLESMLMDMHKPANQSIDTHIEKFSALMAQILAQQETSSRYTTPRRNQYFLRTLENAENRVEAEKWLNFVTYIGQLWHSTPPESLYAQARSWYESKIKHFVKADELADDLRVLAISSSSRSQNQSKPMNSPKRSDFPTDPKGWCDYHRRPGHTTEQCQSKLKDPDYLKYLESQLSSFSLST